VLYDTYGAAPTWFARWMIFRDQPELAQIGTITSVVAIVAIIAVTFRRIVREIRRWLRPSSGYRENGEFAPGD
jgi:hypothetical protein